MTSPSATLADAPEFGVRLAADGSHIRVDAVLDHQALENRDVRLRIESVRSEVVLADAVFPFPAPGSKATMVFVLEERVGWPTTFEGIMRGLPPTYKRVTITYQEESASRYEPDESARGQSEGRRSLLEATTEAWRILAKNSGRRILIIVGTGVDRTMGPSELERMVGMLTDARIETYAVRVGDHDRQEARSSMQRLGYTRSGSASNESDFEAEVDAIAKRIGSLVRIDFEHPITPLVDPCDRVHFTLVIDGADVASAESILFDCPPPRRQRSRSRIVVLVLAALGVVGLSVVLALRSKR